MNILRTASLALLVLGASCGSGGGTADPTAPTALSYADDPAVYTQGFAITPNVPSVTGVVVSWSVAPALPTGLVLEADGRITGTPLSTQVAADFTVTATNTVGATNTTVNIEVRAPAPRALYVSNLTDNTISSYHIGSLIHSGYALSAGTSPRALAARPDGAFIYAANNASSDIEAYSVDPISGKLSAGGAPVASGAQPTALATDIAGDFLFSANQGGDSITTFTIDAGVPVFASTAATGTAPAALAVDPTGSFLYAANSISDDVEAFTIDGVTGALTSAGVVAAAGEPRGLTVATTPAGSFLYAANSTGGTISQWSIDPATGVLTALAPAIVAAGGDPRAIAAHPEGTFLYVANRGTDTIGMYAIDQLTGALTALGTPTIGSGTGPNSLQINPAGDALYVSTEFDREVSEFAIAGDGSLSHVTSVRTRGNPTGILLGPAEVPLVISSQNAYAAAQGSGGNIGQFDADAGATDVVPLDPATVATAGATPRGIGIHPDGTLTVASSEAGTSISLFTRDTGTGHLSFVSGHVTNSTSDIQFEPTGRFAYATNRLVGIQPYTVDQLTPSIAPLTLVSVGVDPRGFGIDPTGQFLYLSDTTTGVFMFRITATTGELVSLGSIAADGGTVDVTVHPSGRWAYASNSTGHSISMYSIDAASGSLTALTPPTISTGGGTTPVGITFSPDGQDFYVAYSGSDTIAHFSVSESTGLLTFVGSEVTFAEQPQSVAVDASGSLVLAANAGSTGVLTRYSRDTSTGVLTGAGFESTDGAPTVVRFSTDLD